MVGGIEMDTRSRYQRIFLIFSPEDAGFGVGQEPSGYVKIEVNEGKGKLSASVQNLNDSRGLSYKLYMMKCSEGSFSQVCVGKIPLVRNKGELKWEFEAANVGGSRIPVQEFNVAAIIGENANQDKKIVICPAAAYKNGKVQWREQYRRQIRNAERQEQKPVESVEKPVEIIENPVEQGMAGNELESGSESDIQSKSGYSLESKYSGQDIESISPVKKEEEPEEEAPVEVSEEPSESIPSEEAAEKKPVEEEQEEVSGNGKPDEAVSEGEKKAHEDRETENLESDFDEYKKMLSELEEKERAESGLPGQTGCNTQNAGFCTPLQNWGADTPCQNCQMQNYQGNRQAEQPKQQGSIERLRINLEKFFEPYDPFRSRRRDYRWWKAGSPVQLNNILYQCDIKTPLLFNPALMMAHFKYRHLIIGIYSDRMRRREYIVCGVPGVYNVDERPFGNMCRWAQVEGNRPRHGAFGYWLVYIDGKTGKFLSIN